jgi:hypothetical protein
MRGIQPWNHQPPTRPTTYDVKPTIRSKAPVGAPDPPWLPSWSSAIPVKKSTAPITIPQTPSNCASFHFLPVASMVRTCRSLPVVSRNSPQWRHFLAVGFIGSEQNGHATVTSRASCGLPIGGGGVSGKGMSIRPPHPGQLTCLPAYLSAALIPLPQCGHSMRIGMITPQGRVDLV